MAPTPFKPNSVHRYQKCRRAREQGIHYVCYFFKFEHSQYKGTACIAMASVDMEKERVAQANAPIIANYMVSYFTVDWYILLFLRRFNRQIEIDVQQIL